MSENKVIKVEKIKTQLFSTWAFGPGLHANYNCLACGGHNAYDGGWAEINCHDCGTTTITLGEYRDEREPSSNIWGGDDEWYLNLETGGDPSGMYRFGPFKSSDDAHNDLNTNVYFCECGRRIHRTITCLCKKTVVPDEENLLDANAQAKINLE